MLVMLLIGWIVLLPAIVVAGLYIGSSVLSRRRAALHAYEDLFTDEESVDPAPEHEPPPAAIETARRGPAQHAGRRADPAVDETPSVAARY